MTCDTEKVRNACGYQNRRRHSADKGTTVLPDYMPENAAYALALMEQGYSAKSAARVAGITVDEVIKWRRIKASNEGTQGTRYTRSQKRRKKAS